jgi:hypothetical protein
MAKSGNKVGAPATKESIAAQLADMDVREAELKAKAAMLTAKRARLQHNLSKLDGAKPK